MKVLIVTNAFPKFSETFIRDQVINLIDRGVEVLILVEDLDLKELGALKGFESYDLMSKTIQVHSLMPRNGILKLFNAIFILVTFKLKISKAFLKKLRTSIIEKGLRRTVYEIHILRFLESNNISLMHAHFGNNGEEMSFASRYGQQLFTTFHGYDIRNGLENGNTIYKNLIASNTPIISISEYNRVSLISMGFNESRILDLANGINTDFFKREESTSCKDKLRLISVARLSPEKGLDIAVKSIRKLAHSKPELNIEYTVIGEGKLRRSLESLIEDLELKDIVKLIGAKSSYQTRDELIKSDLFLLPSLAEALPTVILEAQSVELPVLATKVGFVEGMVKGGVVVKPNSVDDFYNGLMKLINNREKWSEMGKLGRSHVMENHSLSKQTNKLIEFYKIV